MLEINAIIEHAAATIRAMPEMNAVPVIEVHKGNVVKNLEIAVAKTRFAVLVGWNGFKARSNSSKTIVGDTNLVIEIFEMPLINAGGVAHGDAGPRLLPAARAIANAVNLSQPPSQSPIVFSEIAPVSEPRPGTISTNVIFSVSNSTL